MLDTIAAHQSVLILGFGREGRATYRFLRTRFPALAIGIADQHELTNPPTNRYTTVRTRHDYLEMLTDYAVVVKSPGISPHTPAIAAAVARGTTITSLTQLFFEACPSQKIIGVTGTKGKSTTSTLLYHTLAAHGLASLLVGNIGTPALDYLAHITPETWVVCELSSFQLMDLTVSPHIAVLLPFYADHLDYHTDIHEYHAAKYRLTAFQTPDDYLICHASHHAVQTRAHTYVFSGADVEAHVTTNLLGTHNKINIMPSVIIGTLLGIPQQKIYAALATFQPLATRLEHCGTYNAITFFADTLATIPEATIAAIEALRPTTLIAGGHDRNQDYQTLAKVIVHSPIATLILFPETGQRLGAEVEKITSATRVMTIAHATSMDEAVSLAFTHTPAGSRCLLSPAAPSFSLFHNYLDEAQQYKTAIAAIGNTIA